VPFPKTASAAPSNYGWYTMVRYVVTSLLYCLTFVILLYSEYAQHVIQVGQACLHTVPCMPCSAGVVLLTQHCFEVRNVLERHLSDSWSSEASLTSAIDISH
jgi:hypothetical protein